jgi:hypothetical protein
VGWFEHPEGAKSFVTPAQAGVQESTFCTIPWIPAFAGMTVLAALPNPASM